MRPYLLVFLVVLIKSTMGEEEELKDQELNMFNFDELKIKWDDDIPSHPRRLEKEAVDYVEKTINIADQVAAMIGGFDGAVNIATILHDELSEVLGHVTPEMEARKKERTDRLANLMPLFDVVGIGGIAGGGGASTKEPKPNSQEIYSFDMGSPDQKTHTAKDMIMDAFDKFVKFVKSNETRPKHDIARIFDDEL